MDFELTEEQQLLVATARRVAEENFSLGAFERDGFAWDSLAVLADAGLTGLALPVESGGHGATLLDAVLVLDAISEVCPHGGDAFQATNFGAIRQLARFGSERVKAEVLARLLAGNGLVTAGMSEPDAGSALTDMRTAARVDGDSVVINGEKCWNSNGPDATHVVVWCRFGPRTADIGAVVVPVDTPGFQKGETQRYMSGERFCSLYLDECRLPRDYVLADSGALRTMLATFGVERIGNATRALALAEASYAIAVAHANERRQFGRLLSDFQGIQWKLADMRISLDAARLLIMRAAANGGTDAPVPLEAAIAKAHTNQVAFSVANEALQILGAAGYSTSSPVEYCVRRIRGWMIAGGSVEMMRNSIAEHILGRRLPQRPPLTAEGEPR